MQSSGSGNTSNVTRVGDWPRVAGAYIRGIRIRASRIRRRRLTILLQIVMSTTVVVAALLTFFMQAGVAAETLVEDRPVTPHSLPTWSSALDDARFLNRMIVIEGSEGSQSSTVVWSPHVRSLLGDLDQLVSSSGFETAGLEAHREALGELVNHPDSVSPKATAALFDDLIVALDEMAVVDRVKRVSGLEDQARETVRGLGTVALLFAMTAVAVTVGLVGLGTAGHRARSRRAEPQNAISRNSVVT